MKIETKLCAKKTVVKGSALLAALVLASCGGGSDNDNPTATSPATSNSGSGTTLPNDVTVKVKVLSSAPSLVSGEDALIELELVNESPATNLKVLLNDRDLTSSFVRDAVTGRQVGRITGLKSGDNQLTAQYGNYRTTLALTAYPISGPMISGPHETPFVCTTQDFILPNGSKLGIPLDSNCSAATNVQYVYRTSATPASFKPFPSGTRPTDLGTTTTIDGKNVPYIVRVETGTINRAIYQTAILHDPANEAAPSPTSVPKGWNRKLVYPLGGGCQGGWYNQGLLTLNSPEFGVVPLLTVVDDAYLKKGYAVASSTLNIFANNCNDLLSSETTMMVKERFIESFGVPVYTIGTGGSGGAYQSNQTAQNYPGLFDGIITSSSFPDPTTGFPMLADTRLLDIYFNATRAGLYSEAKRKAVSGLRQPGNITYLSSSTTTSALRLDPRASFSLVMDFPLALRYNPVTNPTGARATPYDHTVNVFGRREGTTFAQRPMDNVGVQYGLKALNNGSISIEEFLDLNEQIGGVDIDFNHTPQRTVADREAVRRAYQSGRILSGGGGLASTPVITQPGFDEGTAPSGGIHLKFWSQAIRERLIKTNGTSANQVIVGPGRIGDDLFNQMDRWLMAIKADVSSSTTALKVATHKPADLVDACWTATGQKIAETQTAFGAGQCNTLYPADMTPALVAGASLAHDVIKCELRPVAPSDYAVMFTPAQMVRMNAVFPGGVCDWTKPGVEQQPLKDTWLSFGPSPVNLLFDVNKVLTPAYR